MANRCLIMGIVNVTPDSFSDGGLYTDIKAARERALTLAQEGADIIDIGGESTRPGAAAVSLAEEKRRILPVIEAIREVSDVPISIDTRKAEVAYEAVMAGAQWINDISAATFDPEMAKVMAETQVSVVIMHMRGEPTTMQDQTEYGDLVNDVRSYLLERATVLKKAGVKEIVIDPGLGFAKTAEQNLTLLKNLALLKETGYPVLIGASRKSFIKKIVGDDSSNILDGSLAVAAHAIHSGCDILRVHDVRETACLVRTLQAIENESLSP